MFYITTDTEIFKKFWENDSTAMPRWLDVPPSAAAQDISNGGYCNIEHCGKLFATEVGKFTHFYNILIG